MEDRRFIAASPDFRGWHFLVAEVFSGALRKAPESEAVWLFCLRRGGIERERSAVIVAHVIGIFEDMPGEHGDTDSSVESFRPRPNLRIPATVVAEAGSQPMPSRPIMALASAISCSVTVMMLPCDRSTARSAFFQETGAPIFMAVARVRGLETTSMWSGICSSRCGAGRLQSGKQMRKRSSSLPLE